MSFDDARIRQPRRDVRRTRPPKALTLRVSEPWAS
jgi:hypothetical protein